MKKINIITSCLLLASPCISAFTLDDIFQGKEEVTILTLKQVSSVFESGVYLRNPNVSAKYNGSFGATMQRVPGSDNQVKISGIAFNEYFPETAYSFIFTLADNGTQLVLGKNEVSPDDNRTKLQAMTANGSRYTNPNVDLVFDITQNSDGSFHFQSASGYSVGLNIEGNNFGDYHYSANAFEFDTYEAGYQASETFEHWVLTNPNLSTSMVSDYTTTRTYPLSVDMNYSTKVCTIKNFANQGYLVDNYGKTAHLTGTINTTNKTITFKETTGYPQQMKYSTNGYSWTLYSLNYTLHTLEPKKTASQTYNDVSVGATATYDDREDVHHNDTEHAWVTNDGKRRTLDGFSMTFEKPVLFFMNESGPYSPTGTYEKKFGAGFNGWAFGYRLPRASAVYKDLIIGKDVTLDVDFEISDNGYGVSDDYIYLNATLTENKNFQYVDHYEVYMVPGKFKSINDADFVHHLEIGHEQAINITDHVSSFNRPSTPKRAAVVRPQGGVGQHNFNLLVPASAVGGTTDAEKGYTFFVKANYITDESTGEPMLAPTFHNLAYMEKPTITGISDATADSNNALVSVADGHISISGTDDAVAVYAVSGAIIYQGNDRSISVAPGAYIVRIGTGATKVIVK